MYGRKLCLAAAIVLCLVVSPRASHAWSRQAHPPRTLRCSPPPRLGSWTSEDGLIDPSRVPDDFRAGFVSIVGLPNVGKSTLMNQLIGDRLSITTAKAQTTRHRITGVFTGDDFQIVYSDTPGILQPRYRLQTQMMKSVSSAYKDADVILAVVDPFLNCTSMGPDAALPSGIVSDDRPVVLALNKIDLVNETHASMAAAEWERALPRARVLPISASTGDRCEELLRTLVSLLPRHPPLFPEETLTDRPERFFVTEMVREQLFQLYKKEVPYSSEVVVTSFKDDGAKIRIQADVVVDRESQKGIILGRKGASIRDLRLGSEQSLRDFFARRVKLELRVKVAKDWRSREDQLRTFGYLENT